MTLKKVTNMFMLSHWFRYDEVNSKVKKPGFMYSKNCFFRVLVIFQKQVDIKRKHKVVSFISLSTYVFSHRVREVCLRVKNCSYLMFLWVRNTKTKRLISPDKINLHSEWLISSWIFSFNLMKIDKMTGSIRSIGIPFFEILIKGNTNKQKWTVIQKCSEKYHRE